MAGWAAGLGPSRSVPREAQTICWTWWRRRDQKDCGFGSPVQGRPPVMPPFGERQDGWWGGRGSLVQARLPVGFRSPWFGLVLRQACRRMGGLFRPTGFPRF